MSLGHVIVLTLVLPFVFAAVAPYTVNVAVADLRSAPIPPNVSFAMDSNQQSQLLYAEAVNVLGNGMLQSEAEKTILLFRFRER